LADSLFSELKRRNVFKVGIAYLMLAWVVVQVTESAVPAFGMPDWVNTVVFYFGIIGFPFIIFFSWVFEITPEGIKKESDIALEDSIVAHTGRKLDFITIGLLAIGMGYFFWESRFSRDVSLPEIAGNSTEENQKAVNDEAAGSSIAVLPFVNMSDDKANEHFSDGISEEILNVLAKIPKLHVTSRSSAFAFKDSKINISEVATKLGVKNVLEGSVRKSKNRIRITAQLIEAATDKHLWSQTYDRELDDIFEIQDEISSAIVASLKEKLGIKSNLKSSRSINVELYNEYLIGKQRQAKQTKEDLQASMTVFNDVINKDPKYLVPKIALVLASIQSERFADDHEQRDIAKKSTDVLVKKYLTTVSDENENLNEYYGVLGFYHLKRFQYEQAKFNLDKAIALNENYAEAYLWRADIHYENSQFLKMLADREKAYKLDPMSLEISRELAYDYRSFWRPDDAEKIIDKMFRLHPNHPDAYIARATNQSSHGRYAESTITLEKAVAAHPENNNFKDWLAWSYVVLDQREAAKNLNIDWTDFEFARRDADYELSQKLLKTGIEKDGIDEWLEPAADLYRESEQLDNLKTILEKQLSLFEKNNFPWRKRCFPHLIDNLKATGLNDGVGSMMAKCNEDTEQRVKAGYLCPCSWFRLVAYAILDERYEDAIKRAEEWLDNGDSDPRLKTDALFNKLKDHPKYPELLKRNEQQVQRQIRIYNKLSKDQVLST